MPGVSRFLGPDAASDSAVVAALFDNAEGPNLSEITGVGWALVQPA